MTYFSNVSASYLNPTTAIVENALRKCDDVKGIVNSHINRDRVERYVKALSNTAAPSGVASLMRAPVLHELLTSDGAFSERLRLEYNVKGTGTSAISVGSGVESGLWYVAHLDTISYLLHPRIDDRFPLVPFCYHLTENGERHAQVIRYNLDKGIFDVIGEGILSSRSYKASFIPSHEMKLRPGDRVVPIAPFELKSNGTMTGHFDNAGGVAALALASPVLSEIGANAFLAMPDEEEGPAATGNQSISRGGSRLMAAAPSPRLSVVVDMQQSASEGNVGPDGAGVLGSGAVLSEFSSLARGAVTPPPLYCAVSEFTSSLGKLGATVKETSNFYTSRSDDVSIMQRNQNIVLLGFPGQDRHFDSTYPTAHIEDLVHLSRALVYISILSDAMGVNSHD